jgi:antitoxin CptB
VPRTLCAIGNGRYINVPTSLEGGGEAVRRQAQRGDAAGLSKIWFFMQDDLDVRRRRAAYRASHRGTKEMDIVLGRYAEARLAAMSAAELDAFERFLALPDPLITSWFANGETAEDAGEFAIFVAALRAHHGLTPSADGGGSDKQ